MAQDQKRDPAAGVSRRSVLKVAAAGALAGAAATLLSGQSSASAVRKRTGKTLIVFFSRTGNTREVASQIHQRVGGDLFELRTAHSYPKEYRATTDQAKRELEARFRPQLVGDIKNIDAYDVVFLGYPNWWGTMPMALFSFIEKYKLAGKTLMPFCTHEGSRLGRSEADLKALCPNSTVLEGLALRGGNLANVKAESAQRDVAEWLQQMGMAG
jgi:flavodoxin